MSRPLDGTLCTILSDCVVSPALLQFLCHVFFSLLLLPTPFLLTLPPLSPTPSPPSSPIPSYPLPLNPPSSLFLLPLLLPTLLPLPQSTECEHAVRGACTHQDCGRMGTRDKSRRVWCGPLRGSTTPPECDRATATLPAATGGLVARLPQDIHTGGDSKMCSKISNDSITLKAIYSRGFIFRKLLRVK